MTTRPTALGNLQHGSQFEIPQCNLFGTLLDTNQCEAIVRVISPTFGFGKVTGFSLATVVHPLPPGTKPSPQPTTTTTPAPAAVATEQEPVDPELMALRCPLCNKQCTSSSGLTLHKARHMKGLI